MPIKVHNTLMQKELNGDPPLYRSRDWNKFERRYKEGGYDSVMLIPAPQGSALKKSYDQNPSSTENRHITQEKTSKM